MMRVWGQNAEGLTRTLDVHVAWIRNKLNIGASGNKVRLVAIHGYGYRLMQVES
jgi:DNA-binding response OmpR family regulator